jgi:long-chain acyl-CoA synthetase
MCIHADPLESKIVAIVVPNPKALTALQKENGIDQSDINNSKILEVIGNDFIDSANSAGFKGAEILKTFRLVEGEWTPENGMLTAAQKIKRKEIVEAYKDQIDSMYGR